MILIRSATFYWTREVEGTSSGMVKRWSKIGDGVYMAPT